ncbi:Imm26 family immunity protein [Gottfriedia sp. NPDC057991]|uniref:Imm26 family immunity protein n=1 Tax=Gottfriedia sp. NPDC057991 TaxID=3346298 RepID=UPI0036DD5D16
MVKRIRRKVGNIYVIPLPNGNYAFGRTFRDASIGIYNHIGMRIEDLPRVEDYQFIVGVYNDVLTSGEWPIVDYRPFETIEEEWPPPNCIVDSISGEFSIYHKSEIRKAFKEECEGLEIAAVWESEHIIDRIMGDEKWTNEYIKIKILLY